MAGDGEPAHAFVVVSDSSDSSDRETSDVRARRARRGRSPGHSKRRAARQTGRGASPTAYLRTPQYREAYRSVGAHLAMVNPMAQPRTGPASVDALLRSVLSTVVADSSQEARANNRLVRETCRGARRPWAFVDGQPVLTALTPGQLPDCIARYAEEYAARVRALCAVSHHVLYFLDVTVFNWAEWPARTFRGAERFPSDRYASAACIGAAAANDDADNADEWAPTCGYMLVAAPGGIIDRDTYRGALTVELVCERIVPKLARLMGGAGRYVSVPCVPMLCSARVRRAFADAGVELLVQPPAMPQYNPVTAHLVQWRRHAYAAACSPGYVMCERGNATGPIGLQVAQHDADKHVPVACAAMSRPGDCGLVIPGQAVVRAIPAPDLRAACEALRSVEVPGMERLPAEWWARADVCMITHDAEGLAADTDAARSPNLLSRCMYFYCTGTQMLEEARARQAAAGADSACVDCTHDAVPAA